MKVYRLLMDLIRAASTAVAAYARVIPLNHTLVLMSNV
jgi:hypothetical protein